MSAYIIAEVDVANPEAYEEYKRLAPISIAAYGGRYIVRGGAAQALEGTWQPKRVVVLEFPSVERAKQWWASPEYAPAKAIRQRTSSADIIVIDGFVP